MSPVPALPLVLTINIEGYTLSSSLLPDFPEVPVSFHSNTPVLGVILPLLHDASKIMALQVHVSNSSCLFPMLCVLAQAFKLAPH